MKIVCDKCGGIIAHVIGKSLVEAVRQGHKFSVVGKDYSVMLSCPNTGECSNKVAITVENGEVLLDNLKRKEVENNEEGKETPDSGEGTGEPTGTPEGTEPRPESPKPDDGKGQEDGGKDGKGEGSEGEESGDENRNASKPEGSQGDEHSGEDGGKLKERKYTRV